MKKTKKLVPIITVLGCGTSVGVPMIGMQQSSNLKKALKNPKNHRMRASILIEPFGRPGPAILIDTSPDLRAQALKFFPQKSPRLDAILLTHTHADHLHGLDDIRPFNFHQKSAIPLYALPQHLEEVKTKFSYIFQTTQEGGGKPRLSLQEIGEQPFYLKETDDARLKSLKVLPIPLEHGAIPCLGFRIGNIAYITDCSYIPDETIAKMQGLEVLLLDCLRYRPHSTHMHVDLSIDYARRIGAKKTVMTHMGWEIEYESFRKSLPRGIVPAYDGMKLRGS